MRCAHCASPMQRTRSSEGQFWLCRCGGRMGTLALLRRSLDAEPLTALWTEARAGRGRAGRSCPACAAPMREVPLMVETSPGATALVDLDVCSRCQLVFFDPEEFEQMPMQAIALAPRGPAAPLPTRAPVASVPTVDPLLQAKLDRIAKTESLSAPVPPWKVVAALFAPVEVNAPPLRLMPVVTWGLSILLALITLLTLGDLQRWVAGWGYVPGLALRHGGLTVLSSFFLHGGLLHLVGNLWFLMMFGDNVEDFLGTRRYAAVLAASTLGGLLLHTLAEPASMIPMIGASGGISGVVIFYALRFPQARLGVLVRFRWFTLPAWLYMLFWVGLQTLGGLGTAFSGGSGVAYLAHLGGAAVGAGAYALWGRKG